MVSPLFLWSAWAESLLWQAIGNAVGLVTPLFIWSESAHLIGGGPVEKGRWSGLASLPSVGVGYPCIGGQTGKGLGLVSSLFLWSAWAQSMWWRNDRQERWYGHASVPLVDVWTLIWPLFGRSAWAQPATVVAGNTGEGVSLASVRLVGVGSASHCGGGHVS
jgi:hypothetical protein